MPSRRFERSASYGRRVASAPYRFVIVDLTTHRVVRICGTATVCTVAVASGKGVHRHEGEILRNRGIVIARSVSVTVTWR